LNQFAVIALRQQKRVHLIYLIGVLIMFDDFIFDNFEEEEKDALLNESVSVKPVVSTVDSTKEKIFPSVTLDELTDEQQDKLFDVLGEGLSKILRDLAADDYLPF
jgi:hypothetical protein